jgi:beta-N-acetylhexosaminidase
MTRGSGGDLDRWAHAVLVASTGGILDPPSWLARRIERGLGGVCLFGRNIAGDGSTGDVRTFTDALRAVRPDVLVCTDEEGGDVTRLRHVVGSEHLGALALAATGDPGITEATARSIGLDLADAGIGWNLAPVADVPASPRSPVIGVRAFGSDPADVARHVAAYVRGLAWAGIAGCVKHFPGHGATDADSHRRLPRVDVDPLDPERLARVDLVPFRAAVDAGVETVMLGHLVVEAIDPRLPASLSPAAVRLLREGLGFTGLIITDALDMDAVATTWTIPGAAPLAIAAGADAVCISGGRHDEEIVNACARALVDGVRAGALPPERLAEAAARVEALAGSRGRGRAAGERVRPAVHLGLGDGTADRSLRVRGRPGLPPGPLDVVVRSGPVNIAAGVVPWHPGALLAAARPGTVVHESAAHLDGRPLVVVVRDLHRHPDHQSEVARLVAERADAVVVEMGVPVLDPGARAWVCSSGASAASAAAVARRLLAPLDGDG